MMIQARQIFTALRIAMLKRPWSEQCSRVKMKMPLMKAVILIAGPQKATNFWPLSLDLPKPLFPLAGSPMIEHQIEEVRNMMQRWQ